MDKLIIQGGVPLEGEVPVSGSKNSALPALAACLLTEEPVILHGIPKVRDLRTMQKLLENIGARIEEQPDGALRIETPTIQRPEAPYDLVKTMRASSLVLRPLAGR